MGEEWGSSQPFPFFCDFHGELGELVRKGRREEFASWPEFRDPAQRERIPDPQAEATFRAGKLDWNQATEGVHAEWIDWYTRILRVRHERIVPVLPEIAGHAGSFQVIATGAIVAHWQVGVSQQLNLAANLSDNTIDGFPATAGTTLWHEGPAQDDTTLRPWTVHWSLTATAQQRHS